MGKLKLAKLPVAAGEDRTEFIELLSIISGNFEPCNPYELYLVSRMAEIHWRMLRLSRHETARLTGKRAERAAGICDGNGTAYLPDGVSDEMQTTIKLENLMNKQLKELTNEFYRARQRTVANQLSKQVTVIGDGRPSHMISSDGRQSVRALKSPSMETISVMLGEETQKA